MRIFLSSLLLFVWEKTLMTKLSWRKLEPKVKVMKICWTSTHWCFCCSKSERRWLQNDVVFLKIRSVFVSETLCTYIYRDWSFGELGGCVQQNQQGKIWKKSWSLYTQSSNIEEGMSQQFPGSFNNPIVKVNHFQMDFFEQESRQKKNTKSTSQAFLSTCWILEFLWDGSWCLSFLGRSLVRLNSQKSLW